MFLGSNLARIIKVGRFKEALMMLEILEIAATVENGGIHDEIKVKRLKEAV